MNEWSIRKGKEECSIGELTTTSNRKRREVATQITYKLIKIIS